MRIYVASSYRNLRQPAVVEALRIAGHDVYDFHAPEGPGSRGFHWSDIDPDWQKWTPEQFIKGLDHEIAHHGFERDMFALEGAQICVLVLPCGRSAHLELGFAVGAGQTTIVLAEEAIEPELMYRMVDYVATSLDEVIDIVHDIEEETSAPISGPIPAPSAPAREFDEDDHVAEEEHTTIGSLLEFIEENKRFCRLDENTPVVISLTIVTSRSDTTHCLTNNVGLRVMGGFKSEGNSADTNRLEPGTLILMGRVGG